VDFFKKLRPSLGLISVIWVVYIIDRLLPISLTQFGIIPRHWKGILGIFFAPFLHANLFHILSNTVPLFFLTAFLYIFHPKKANQFLLSSALLGGGLVWLLGNLLSRSCGAHVGASGVIFSLIAFFIAQGAYKKTLTSLILAIVTLFLYGGSLWGVLPVRSYISWEGHLFGALTGVYLAYKYK